MKKKMNRELKKKWIRALRSGEYDQGTDYLAMNDSAGRTKFCCLGVLCDIIDPNWDVGGMSGPVAWLGPNNRHSERNRLPTRIRVRIGLDKKLQGDLMDLNDNGTSFREIADIISKKG